VKLIASNCLVAAGAASIIYGMTILHPVLGWVIGGALALTAGVRLSRSPRK
jgi:hypothetical protein